VLAADTVTSTADATAEVARQLPRWRETVDLSGRLSAAGRSAAIQASERVKTQVAREGLEPPTKGL